jgi:hypothetical protein
MLGGPAAAAAVPPPLDRPRLLPAAAWLPVVPDLEAGELPVLRPERELIPLLPVYPPSCLPPSHRVLLRCRPHVSSSLSRGPHHHWLPPAAAARTACSQTPHWLVSSPQMKVEICSFSGYKIYPSRGKLYVRGDSKVRPAVSCPYPSGRALSLLAPGSLGRKEKRRSRSSMSVPL